MSVPGILLGAQHALNGLPFSAIFARGGLRDGLMIECEERDGQTAKGKQEVKKRLAHANPRCLLTRALVSHDRREIGRKDLKAATSCKDLRAALLRRNGLGCDRLTGNFPRTLRPVHWRFVATLDPVVVVRLAHRSERFVVKAGQSKPYFQFFSKRLQRFEVVGGRGNFGLRILQEPLLAAIVQFWG